MGKPLHGNLTHDMLMGGLAVHRTTANNTAIPACVGSGPLPDRKVLTIKNLSDTAMLEWGPVGLTYGSGYPIAPGDEVVFSMVLAPDVTVTSPSLILTSHLYIVSSDAGGSPVVFCEGR